jgi:hypothetical protein
MQKSDLLDYPVRKRKKIEMFSPRALAVSRLITSLNLISLTLSADSAAKSAEDAHCFSVALPIAQALSWPPQRKRRCRSCRCSGPSASRRDPTATRDIKTPACPWEKRRRGCLTGPPEHPLGLSCNSNVLSANAVPNRD